LITGVAKILSGVHLFSSKSWRPFCIVVVLSSTHRLKLLLN